MNNRPKFDIGESYKAVDLKSTGAIKKNDIGKFLEDRHYFATEKELGIIMDRFDKNKDGIITYSEYIQEFTQRLAPRI